MRINSSLNLLLIFIDHIRSICSKKAYVFLCTTRGKRESNKEQSGILLGSLFYCTRLGRIQPLEVIPES